MSTQPAIEGLPDLVDVWLTGFGISRQVPVRRIGGVVEVEVGGRERRLELVLVEPDERLLDHTLARLPGSPDVWSTIFTSQPLRRGLPAGTRVQLIDEALMTVLLEAPAEAEAEAGAGAEAPALGALELTVDGDRAFVSLLDQDVIAARGQVAVAGDTAVFDRIETVAAYRRRGLGTAVMNALADWAVGQGATRGLLAASVEGQALYTRLGWRPVAAMLTVAGEAQAQ